MPTIPIRWADNTKELVQNLSQGLNQVEVTRASVDKLVQSFQGDKIAQAANRWTASISEVGGVTKLTASEQDRANAIFDKYIEKQTALGRIVPESISALSEQVKATIAAREATDQQSDALDRQLGIFPGFISKYIEARSIFELMKESYAGLTELIAGSVEAYGRAEQAEVRLEGGLRAVGLATPAVVSAYRQYAEELEHTTTVSRAAAVEAEGTFTLIGNVGPAQMQKALQAAADFSAVTGKSFEDAALAIAKATDGNVTQLKRYGIEIDKAALDAGGIGVVFDAIEEKMHGQAELLAGTMLGSWQQLQNQWERAQEQLGAALTPAIADATSALGGLVGVVAESPNAFLLLVGASTALAGSMVWMAALAAYGPQLAALAGIIGGQLTANVTLFSESSIAASGSVLGLSAAETTVAATSTAAAGSILGLTEVTTGLAGAEAAAVPATIALTSALGPLAAIIATASAAWMAGKWLGEKSGLTDYYANATKGVLASQEFAAKQDTLARASQLAGRSITDYAEAVKFLNDRFGKGAEAADNYAKVNKRVAAAIADANSSMSMLSGEQVEAIKYYLQQKVGVSEIAAVLGIYKTQVEQVKESITQGTDAQKKATEAVAQHQKAVAGIVASLSGQTESYENTFEAIRQLISAGPMEEDVARRVVDALDKIHAAHGKMPADLEAWRESSEGVGTAYKTLQSTIAAAAAAIPAMIAEAQKRANVSMVAGLKNDLRDVTADNKFAETYAAAAAAIFPMIAAAQKKANEGQRTENHITEKDIIDSTRREEAALEDLSNSFGELGQAIALLGPIARGTFGSILGDIGSLLGGAGQVVATLRAAKQAGAQYRDGNNNPMSYGVASGMFAATNHDGTKVSGMQRASSAIASGAAIVGGAASVWDATDQSRTAGGNALGGAMAGAQAGAAFGPWGMAVGAAAGLVVGLIRGKPDWAKAADEVGRDFGTKISDGLAKEIAKSAKDDFHGSRQAASIGAMDKIISEAGGLNPKNLDTFEARLRDTFSMIATGQMTVAQGTAVLDKNWDAFAAAGTDAYGFLDSKLREVIKLQDQYGTQSQAITKYLQQQASAAIGGSNDIIGSLDDQMKGWDELKGKIDAATGKQTSDKAGGASDSTMADDAAKLVDLYHQQAGAAGQAKQQLEDMATIAVGTFGAAIASGMSFADALKAAGPGLTNLRKAFGDLGIDIDNAAFKSLSMQAQLQQNNPALIKGVGGLGTALAGLSNMGLLNVDTFHAMQRSGTAMAQDLFNKATEMGGGLQDALVPMQDYLHQAMKAAEELGVPLDDNTQLLIDQSKQAGIWKDAVKSPTDILIGTVQTLADKMQEFLDKLNGIPPKKKVDINVNTDYTHTGTPPSGNDTGGAGLNIDGSPDYDGDPSTPMAFGGMVRHATRALLGERGVPEAAIPLDQAPAFFSDAMRLAMIGMSAGVPMQLGAPAASDYFVPHSLLADSRDIYAGHSGSGETVSLGKAADALLSQLATVAPLAGGKSGGGSMTVQLVVDRRVISEAVIDGIHYDDGGIRKVLKKAAGV